MTLTRTRNTNKTAIKISQFIIASNHFVILRNDNIVLDIKKFKFYMIIDDNSFTKI